MFLYHVLRHVYVACDLEFADFVVMEGVYVQHRKEYCQKTDHDDTNRVLPKPENILSSANKSNTEY